MPVITLFSGSFCNSPEVAGRVLELTRYRLVDDQALIAEAAREFNMDEGKLMRALMGKTSMFNRFTHEKERSLACLRSALAQTLKEDNLLLAGFAGLMVPSDISHVLRVCLIGDLKHRVEVAAQSEGLSEKEAIKRIHREDEARVLWVQHLYQKTDPWSPDLFDMVIPMDKTSIEDAARLIHENVQRDVLQVSDASRKAVDDFVLAAGADMQLAREGHDVTVLARDGVLTLTINKHVLMLSALENELKKIVSGLPGVRGVETRVGAGYHQADVYRKFDFDVPLPSKVLLVDDEREFVQTLSERLQMRDMGTAVVFDGHEALSALEDEEPEVMVLDLKMPGIDGLEVLRRVKAEHPNVEVIVLTGHGSEEAERACLEMGACAYLEKPVDMEVLTQTMKDAYKRIRDSKKDREP